MRISHNEAFQLLLAHEFESLHSVKSAVIDNDFFSSPEPKAHGELIVYRSIRRPSVSPCVRPSVRKHF